ncbi:CPBP family glutamic-type intramembrane protease [Palleronia sp. KMU-117]|uniref:CPBP family glutamic-type intramembrane protease n=1 Tax=Palleronia sp. KMU-117 TaxID=3434108 RepID=UPI003D72CED0
MNAPHADDGQQDLSDSSLVPFLGLSFGIAWGVFALFALFPRPITALLGAPSGHHPLFILAVYAPAIAALFLVWRRAGGSGLRRFLSRILLWRMPAVWWAVLILGIPVVFAIGAAMKGTLWPPTVSFDGAGALLGAIAFMLVLGPVEELGWRGLMLPVLQRRMAPVWAGLAVGAVWGLWHMPAFLLSGTPQAAWGFLPFVVGTTAISVILTAMFNAARGSLLIAGLFHFQMNNPLWPDAQPYDTWVFVAAALATVWICRRSMLGRDPARTGAVTRVLPD